MRIDVITIFPDYLAPLDLSLIGKACRAGALEVRTHDLRAATTDRHRTVDDTPYGGGAGMVMKPDVWGRALDRVLAQAPVGARPRLIVPGPSGRVFDQRLARELARERHLVFACGRYEGIDERVHDYAREVVDDRVDVVSLGDYVLNGGEVAALAMIEAITRLIPGVVGNAASLVEESHEDGLLEYPVYTKPPVWAGLEVPPVLLSGDHARIAAWRHEQRLERTAQRRPDLLPPSSVPEAALAGGGEGVIVPATPGDAGELLTLYLATLPRVPLPEPAHDDTLVARVGGRLVGAVHAQRVESEYGPLRRVHRLAVVPDLQRRGLGTALLAAATAGDSRRMPIELYVPPEAPQGTGEDLAVFMRKAGYRPARSQGQWQRAR